MLESNAFEKQATQAASVLDAAGQILAQWQASPEPARRQLLLRHACLLARVAAALLLEPGFPAPPAGIDRLLYRDLARRAARQLATAFARQKRSYTRKGAGELTSHVRQRGLPSREIDWRLTALTATSLQELRSERIELLREYLFLSGQRSLSRTHSDVHAATLALMDCYWRSGRRLLQIIVEPSCHPRPRRSRRDITSQMHPPKWQEEVSWEIWKTLDQRYLFWSDPASDAETLNPSS